MSQLAIVTGANRGLGFEVCRQLGREGYGVIATARDRVQGEAAARALRGESLDVVAAVLDVADTSSVDALTEHVRSQGRPVDVLVNNAGISMKGFDDVVVRMTLEVNFHGAVRVTDALLPLLARDARVVMVSSGMGELSAYAPEIRRRFESSSLTRGELDALVREFVHQVESGTHEQAGWPSSAYRVSKAALNAFTRILAREFVEANSRIRVNAVCPGWVRTDMGGPNAPRDVTKGAASIVWAALLGEDGPTGGFFRDGRPASW